MFCHTILYLLTSFNFSRRIINLLFCYRFGYDYGGGYDRDMGGRPGYAEDRPHGRFGRQSGGYQGGPGMISAHGTALFLRL